MATHDVIRRIPHVPIKPLPDEEKIKEYPVMGAWMGPAAYFSANIRGKTGSGKSVLIEAFLNARCGPETKVLIFARSVSNDRQWTKIIKMLRRNGIRYATRSSIFGVDAQGKKINHIEDFIKAQAKQGEIDQAIFRQWERQQKGLDDHNKDRPIGMIRDPYAKKKERPFLPTIDPFLLNVGGVMQQYCPWIIVCDDLSVEMRNPQLTAIIKEYRHYHCSVISSSQAVKDSTPQARDNYIWWYLFKGLGPTLYDVWKAIGTGISYERFEERYRKATEERYSFLTIDTVKDIMMIKNEAIFEEV